MARGGLPGPRANPQPEDRRHKPINKQIHARAECLLADNVRLSVTKLPALPTAARASRAAVKPARSPRAATSSCRADPPLMVPQCPQDRVAARWPDVRRVRHPPVQVPCRAQLISCAGAGVLVRHASSWHGCRPLASAAARSLLINGDLQAGAGFPSNRGDCGCGDRPRPGCWAREPRTPHANCYSERWNAPRKPRAPIGSSTVGEPCCEQGHHSSERRRLPGDRHRSRGGQETGTMPFQALRGQRDDAAGDMDTECRSGSHRPGSAAGCTEAPGDRRELRDLARGAQLQWPERGAPGRTGPRRPGT